MSMLAISKNLICKFYSYSYRQAISLSRANNSYLWVHFNSRFNSKHFRYYSVQKKWITIFLETTDGTRIKRQVKIGKTIHEALYKDPDFLKFGVCEGTKACSTCHVIFSNEDFNTISKHSVPDEDEIDILDGIANQFPGGEVDFRTDTSRLGCCLNVIPEMDGMVLKLPKTKSLSNT